MKLKLKSKTRDENQIAVLSQNVTEEKFEKVLSADGDTFQTLVDKANAIQNDCVDIPDVLMGDIKLNQKLHLARLDGEAEYRLTPYAFSQLCTKVGVPTQYMKKCIETGHISLVMDNINEWLEENGHKKLLIREYQDVARGILSDKYSCCDTPEILDALDKSGMLANMDLKGYMINPQRFHARFVGDRMKVIGEDLFAGVQIDSSDVGRSKLDVKFLIFKQVCTNGLILPAEAGKIYEQKHIGIDSETMVSTLRDAFSSFNSKVKGATTLINSATDVEVRPTEQMITLIKNGAKVGDDAVEKIFEVANMNYSLTAWGVANAITEVAQDYTLEHRIVMERYAGVLMTQLLKTV